MADMRDDVLARVVEELSELPPVDERAVARIVALAALQRQTGGLADAEALPPRGTVTDEEDAGPVVRPITAAPGRGGRGRWSRWTLAAGAALAAGLAGILLLRGAVSRPERPEHAATTLGRRATEAPAPITSVPGAQLAAADARRLEEAPRVTQFVVDLPGAEQVSLVGDFNGWDPTATPLVRHPASGRWTVAVPLTPGRHRYAYMVNDSVWTLDPTAPRAVDPDFGSPSSVIVVGVR